MNKLQQIVAAIVGIPLTIYILFITLKTLNQQTPDFTSISVVLFGAVVVGAVYFFREKLFH
ncbi:hypothetical protein HYY74_01080 [Candidatus Woesearchaeota archaeon]|nr:hypothetical protein [Candidatus Woesearchaeota archaeon]